MAKEKGPQHASNREMVFQSLRETEPLDEHIIDLLLMLLDDWEVRQAVTDTIKRRKKEDTGATQNIRITQNVNKTP